ncbi:hypothetical protein [Microbispora bryophytorum]|uniref:Uncharacterized protein n=1 Tax=Microbispora bryophytorum TaxID=1460882 RepID=A0A8H9H3A7_9ACTN|nr:hypothetical protein [Microbispora bryophytorum]MBD3138498.1 hypothetical protein [Microbispora bryophytorum]TQS04300.1 hypothetical protein FLX07_21895 [Microbispora bryophytorum]GGO24073.1 hypothetical protein GCM10011574_54090 [Microbispora bryophytorum]
MRHFFGLLLGVVVAAAVLLGGGWASQEAVRGAAQSVDPAKDTRMLIALGVMAVVGLLLGLVLVGRVSPLATFVPSMALLAWTVVYVLDVSRAASLVPTGPSVQAELLQAGRGMLMLLSTGVYGLLGVALFLPVLMPSRWARPESDEEQEEEYEESFGF